MRKLAGLAAFVALLSFGMVTTFSYAGDPAPPSSPTDEKGKPKTSAPKFSARDEKKDEKKDGKGGK